MPSAGSSYANCMLIVPGSDFGVTGSAELNFSMICVMDREGLTVLGLRVSNCDAPPPHQWAAPAPCASPSVRICTPPPPRLLPAAILAHGPCQHLVQPQPHSRAATPNPPEPQTLKPQTP